MLAHHLEQDLRLAPRAVILEGVLAHAWDHSDSWFYDHFAQWDRLRAEYPKAGLLFQNGNLPPLGGTRAEWGNVLFNVGNDFKQSGESLSRLYDEIIKYGETGQLGAEMIYYNLKFKGEDPAYPAIPESYRYVQTQIMCNDLTPAFRWRMVQIPPSGRMEFADVPDDSNINFRPSPNNHARTRVLSACISHIWENNFRGEKVAVLLDDRGHCLTDLADTRP
jgi:hypothetical protein